MRNFLAAIRWQSGGDIAAAGIAAETAGDASFFEARRRSGAHLHAHLMQHRGDETGPSDGGDCICDGPGSAMHRLSAASRPGHGEDPPNHCNGTVTLRRHCAATASKGDGAVPRHPSRAMQEHRRLRMTRRGSRAPPSHLGMTRSRSRTPRAPNAVRRSSNADPTQTRCHATMTCPEVHVRADTQEDGAMRSCSSRPFS